MKLVILALILLLAAGFYRLLLNFSPENPAADGAEAGESVTTPSITPTPFRSGSSTSGSASAADNVSSISAAAEQVLNRRRPTFEWVPYPMRTTVQNLNGDSLDCVVLGQTRDGKIEVVRSADGVLYEIPLTSLSYSVRELFFDLPKVSQDDVNYLANLYEELQQVEAKRLSHRERMRAAGIAESLRDSARVDYQNAVMRLREIRATAETYRTR